MFFDNPSDINRNRRMRRAFSLVEVMIVIVIIGLLAGVVTVNVRSYLTRAKQNAARQEIATIVHALDAFYSTYGRYPTNDEGIDVLSRPSEKLPEPPLNGAPVDPWGQRYQYNSPGTTGPFEVICHGADGREGGDGVDQDITSDNLKE
jgi:general secretion pathway protein G